MESSNITLMEKGDADSISQGTTWIVKGGASEMQSEQSYMVRVNPGQGDDLSSQGSYMVRKVEEQSQGSYMERGFNGQVGNKPIFDDESDGSFVRNGNNSFMHKDVEDRISERSEEADTTPAFK